MTERVDKRGRILVLAVFEERTFYGVCEREVAWNARCEQCAAETMLGESNLALCRSELVNGFCHGDDFVTAAAVDQIEIFGKMLQEKFDTRQIGMIPDKELEVLHRFVRVINDELMEIETDLKHVPQLLKDLDSLKAYCQNSKSETECY